MPETPDADRPRPPSLLPVPRTAPDAQARAALEMVAAFTRSSDRSTRHAAGARMDELLDGHLDSHDGHQAPTEP